VTDVRRESESAAVRDAIRAVRNGDADAYGRIVSMYQRRLFGLVLMVTRQPGPAEEVAQDAFVRAFAHLDGFDDSRPFYPWLSTIAVRLAQNWLLQHARTTAREGGELDPEHRGDAVDPLALIIDDERSRQLWSAVAQLPAGERTAAVLFYRQDMSVDDIARVLGVTSGTVKTHLFRARQRLRRRSAGTLWGKDEQ
jgi:RNA polymerase sigma-70 factor (ECF subfamily)